MTDVGTGILVLLGLFVGTYLCAFFPSWIKASPFVMDLIAIFGGGMIIGVAMIILLPESSSILINASNELARLDGESLDKVISREIMI